MTEVLAIATYLAIAAMLFWFAWHSGHFNIADKSVSMLEPIGFKSLFSSSTIIAAVAGWCGGRLITAALGGSGLSGGVAGVVFGVVLCYIGAQKAYAERAHEIPKHQELMAMLQARARTKK